MTKELVRDQMGQIHRKGCKKAWGRTDSLVSDHQEKFEGTSVKDFAEYWANLWNSENFDETTGAEWLEIVMEELNPCTGITR